MPVKIQKIRNRNLWRVVDLNGKVHAKGTTKAKAEAQARLLNSISARKSKNHNPK